MSGQLHAPAPSTPGGRARGTDWIGCWVGPRTDLDYVEKRKFLTLPGLEIRPLCRPARSQSAYRYAIPAPRLRPKAIKLIVSQGCVSLVRKIFDV
jgi:hypothetical protein